jgi:voltage-gated potassium channel
MRSVFVSRLRVYLTVLGIVLIIGMTGLITFEHFSLLDSFYFIIETVSTVGYGDLHPLTPEGKALTIFVILTGVGCFVGVAANSIEYMIDERERTRRLEKLNMIIGVFFSELGTKLLKKFSAADPALEEVKTALIVSNNWSDEDFSKAEIILKNHVSQLNSRSVQLEELHGLLSHHKALLLSLLENPQMIEHDRFIPLLQAVFHLTEELISRDHLTDLPPADYAHLSGDINRAYGLLIIEWLTYMQYLKKNYPYLFSLAMRQNPFDRNASVIVT